MLLDSLIRQKNILIYNKYFWAINGINGSYIFLPEKIEKVSLRTTILSRIFDIQILYITQKSQELTKIFIPLRPDYIKLIEIYMTPKKTTQIIK